MEQTKHFKKRDAILTCLRGTTTHPSAEWIYMQLKDEIPELSLGTVYRNLAYFKETGKAISVGTVKGIERFDGNTSPHVHFICNSCDAVMDLPQMTVPQELCRQAAQGTGGQVASCQLTFTGTCSQCAGPEQFSNA